MNGISRRDLEFAFQLEELRLIEQVGVLDDRQRARTEHLHDLFGIAATAATEAEARCADLEDRCARLATVHRVLYVRVSALEAQSAEFEERLARIEASLAALPPVVVW